MIRGIFVGVLLGLLAGIRYEMTHWEFWAFLVAGWLVYGFVVFVDEEYML